MTCKTFSPFHLCSVCGDESAPKQHQIMIGNAVVTVDIGGEIPMDNPDIDLCTKCQLMALRQAIEVISENI